MASGGEQPMKIPTGAPRTTEDLKALYDYIYRQPTIRHPGRGRLGHYGSHADRDGFFMEWINQMIDLPATVLDASCGRGHLMVALAEAGFTPEGTEISPYLVEEVLPDLGFPVRLLAYEEFAAIESKSYDVVCSNDVLEHLLGQVSAHHAVTDLARIARQALCVSVGLKRRVVKYTIALGLSENGRPLPRYASAPKTAQKLALDLHRFTPRVSWWEELFRSVMDIDHMEVTPSRAFFFGFPR